MIVRQTRRLASFPGIACVLGIACVTSTLAVQIRPNTEIPATTGLVVSDSAVTADAGALILNQGGNAIDAAVATAFGLAVTHPTAGNIGGAGFMLIRLQSGETVAVDYRALAPMKATASMFVDGTGKINARLAEIGYLAVGVPGTVRGMELAHKRFGKLPWKDVVMPAVRLAENGFAISQSLAEGLNAQIEGGMKLFPASLAAYGKPGGGKWAAGDVLLQRDLGKTLRALATDGPNVFYEGWIAERIAADVQSNGGLIGREDLAGYTAKFRSPVSTTYRGYEVSMMPPPSSGGITIALMLNMLETFDLKKNGRLAPQTLHLLIESMRRAYLDRARHLGDPDFVENPVTLLTSKKYARQLASTISLDRASSSLELNNGVIPLTHPEEGEETTHFSVIDKQGNAVSNTYTLMNGYGSKVVVKGTGILLNNEMRNFNLKPGHTDRDGHIGTPPNSIEPLKRALSNMTPTIVTRNNNLVLVTGSPGGRTIINTVLQVVVNATEFGMSGREAIDLGRINHEWLPETTWVEDGRIPTAALDTLRKMGHVIRTRPRLGTAHSVFVDVRSGAAYGVNDIRSRDSKIAK